MYSRPTQTKSRQQGKPYYTYRLVESERVNGQVKQRTLLNLGRHFDLPKAHWHDLASRIEQLLSGQTPLLSTEPPAELETLARRYQALILARCCEQEKTAEDFQSVDIDSLVLDGSGFPRRSQLFPGNVSEPESLEAMLGALQCRKGQVVVIDAGIATESSITWLKEQGYRYLVVSRKRKRDFDPAQAITIKDGAGAEGYCSTRCHRDG
ncbi:MAG: transposase [Candidatus Polarisedimenticolaceae bacterium]|nr:transposase [Candidatus Polarisedimenticolaceae bacterium]